MDFGIIYQLKTRKFWWLDMVLYAVLSLLLATFICYILFAVKISMQEREIDTLNQKIASTGTASQRELEKQVFSYQKKIDTFATILASHKIPTNIFNIIERDTLPNVWFADFATNSEMSTLNITGEAENLNVLSRQVDVLEKEEYIRSLTNLTTALTPTGRIQFSLQFELDKSAFLLIAEFAPTIPEIIETVSPPTDQLRNIINF